MDFNHSRIYNDRHATIGFCRGAGGFTVRWNRSEVLSWVRDLPEGSGDMQADKNIVLLRPNCTVCEVIWAYISQSLDCVDLLDSHSSASPEEVNGFQFQGSHLILQPAGSPKTRSENSVHLPAENQLTGLYPKHALVKSDLSYWLDFVCALCKNELSWTKIGLGRGVGGG